MDFSFQVQSSRFEYKYLVTEAQAFQIRHFVLGYLAADKYSVGREGSGYAVHSLYFDSPDLLTCWATVEGKKNRFKLRVRFYDDRPQSPLFLEIKRRDNQVISKQRAAVKRSCANRLLAGEWLQRSDLYVDDEQNFRALYNFCELCQKIHARPTAYTSYMREAYESPHNNHHRVTFDRQLRAGPYRGSIDISQLEALGHAGHPGRGAGTEIHRPLSRVDADAGREFRSAAHVDAEVRGVRHAAAQLMSYLPLSRMA